MLTCHFPACRVQPIHHRPSPSSRTAQTDAQRCRGARWGQSTRPLGRRASAATMAARVGTPGTNSASGTSRLAPSERQAEMILQLMARPRMHAHGMHAFLPSSHLRDRVGMRVSPDGPGGTQRGAGNVSAISHALKARSSPLTPSSPAVTGEGSGSHCRQAEKPYSGKWAPYSTRRVKGAGQSVYWKRCNPTVTGEGPCLHC